MAFVLERSVKPMVGCRWTPRGQIEAPSRSRKTSTYSGVGSKPSDETVADSDIRNSFLLAIVGATMVLVAPLLDFGTMSPFYFLHKTMMPDDEAKIVAEVHEAGV